MSPTLHRALADIATAIGRLEPWERGELSRLLAHEAERTGYGDRSKTCDIIVRYLATAPVGVPLREGDHD